MRNVSSYYPEIAGYGDAKGFRNFINSVQNIIADAMPIIIVILNYRMKLKDFDTLVHFHNRLYLSGNVFFRLK